MRVNTFLRMVAEPGRTNFFVVAPDNLGLLKLLRRAMAGIARSQDLHFLDAENITKEKARQVEREARKAALAGSQLTHFYIYRLQNLPEMSVGPLLKAVEEARFSRFIFQAQEITPKLQTLMSRSTVVHLPFFSKKVVLGNLVKMNKDAKTADALGLYDGTLGGTLGALDAKDAMSNIWREMRRGRKGLAAMFAEEILGSTVFDVATYSFLTEEERKFLGRYKSYNRQKIVLFLASERVG